MIDEYKNEVMSVYTEGFGRMGLAICAFHYFEAKWMFFPLPGCKFVQFETDLSKTKENLNLENNKLAFTNYISIDIEIISDNFFCIRKVGDKGTLVFDIPNLIFFYGCWIPNFFLKELSLCV